MNEPAIKVIGRARRVRCKLCLDSRVIEVDTWDDRFDPTFEHDCKGRGPKLSHPTSRDGVPVRMFPIGDRILVEELPEIEQIGGLHIPQTSADRKEYYGTVVAAGPRAMEVLDDAGIQIGDTVCYGKYTGVYQEWRPANPENVKDVRKGWLINAKDIYGSVELAERILDGRMGIAQYCSTCDKMADECKETHAYQYRFFKAIGKKEVTENG